VTTNPRCLISYFTSKRHTKFQVLCGRSVIIFKPDHTTGVSDKHLSLVDTFHVVGKVHLHKYEYWPPFRFPPTVDKCDTIKRNRYLYKQVSFVTSCRLAHCIALGTLTDSSTTAFSCIITITDAFLRHTSRGNQALQDIPGYFLVKNTI